MKILRIYLDTSVISHLDHPDAPDKTADTRTMWGKFRLGKYKAVISEITLLELHKCPEPKQAQLLSYLAELDYELLEQTEEMTELAQRYMEYGALPPKSRTDCLHIAAATTNGCPYIVSWNFKHFVNITTINKVQAVNKMLHYPEINIIPPPMLLEGVD